MRRVVCAVCFTFTLQVLAPCCANSATYTIGEGGDFTTLTAALATAAAGDVLLVSPEVFDSTRGETFPLSPNGSVEIRSASPDARPVIRSDRFNSVFHFDSIDSATIDGLSIETGQRTAVQILSSTVTIVRSVLQSRAEPIQGNGVRLVDSALLLKDCDLFFKLDDSSGSALSCLRSSLTVEHSTLGADTESFVLHGAILTADLSPSVNLRRSNFQGNEVVTGSLFRLRNLGGPKGALEIEDCTVTENTATAGLFRIENFDVIARNLNASTNIGGVNVSQPNYAMDLTGGSLSLIDSRISNNLNMGGAIVRSGTLSIENSVVEANGRDGVIAEYLIMENSRIVNNALTGATTNHFRIENCEIAENGLAGLGYLGNPLSKNPPSLAVDVSIRNNGHGVDESPTSDGPNAAGVQLREEAHFLRCEIVGNRRVKRFEAAGIRASTNVLFEDCLIEGNSSRQGTAAVLVSNGDIVFSRCRLVGNSIDEDAAQSSNGVVEAQGAGRFFFVNSILTGNRSQKWPLFFAATPPSISESGLFFFNCTVEGNDRGDGSFPMIWATNEAKLKLTNTIVWNGMQSLVGPNLMVSHSNIQGEVLPGPSNISEDPQFLHPWDGAFADHHLSCTSPSVDSGTLEGSPSVDITGGHRPRGVGVDMGAYENCTADFNGDEAVDGLDYLAFIQEWYEAVTVENRIFDFVTGPSVPNRIDGADLLKVLEQ